MPWAQQEKTPARLKLGTITLQEFYLQQPVYRLAIDLGMDAKVITRAYQCLHDVLYHMAELVVSKLAGEIELAEPYFSGRCKVTQERDTKGKGIAFSLPERERHIYYTKVVENMTAETLMQNIDARTRKNLD